MQREGGLSVESIGARGTARNVVHLRGQNACSSVLLWRHSAISAVSVRTFKSGFDSNQTPQTVEIRAQPDDR